MFESFRRNCARRAICKWGSCTSLLKGFIKIWLHYMKYIEIIILNGINFIKYLHLKYSEMNEYMNEYIMIEQQNYNNRIISRYCFIATIKVYKCYSPQLPEYLKFFSHVLSYTHTHINHFISNCCAIKWMNGKQIRNMRLLHNSILEYTQINDKWIHCIE